MVPVLNALDIDVACLGNHDLDFGLQEFTELSEACNFPWLCSNAFDAHTNQPLGGCKEYLIMEKNGSKILFVGIVEDAWLDTLASLDPSDIIFESPSDYVKRRVPQLIEECGPFDMVVAVTHMRMPNDIALANECGRGGGGKDGEGGFIDIVLGGHDHHYEDIITNDVRILNSGADFKSYTVVDVHGRSNVTNALETSSRRVDITSNDKPDVDVVQSIQQYKEAVDASMDIVVGRTKTTLDARFGEIRRRETNISNFLAELMTRGTGADVAILNAGSIRADREVEGGELVMRDLCDLLPMADELMVIEVTAERILLALENGVSQYPAMEGRFPCVDGVRFAFDPSKPAGSRVVPGSVYVRDQPLVPKRHIILRGGQTAVTSTTTSIDTIQNGLEKSSLNDDKMEKVVDNSKENAAPKGYSALDFNRKYSLVSKAYLIEGKVSVLEVVFLKERNGLSFLLNTILVSTTCPSIIVSYYHLYPPLFVQS